MNAEYIEECVRTLFPEVDRHKMSFTVGEAKTVVKILGDVTVTFAALKSVSSLFSTRDVCVVYHPNYYSEEDGPQLILEICIGTSMCCGRDHDADGNCDQHPDFIYGRRPGKPERRQVNNRATNRRQDDKTRKRLTSTIKPQPVRKPVGK